MNIPTGQTTTYTSPITGAICAVMLVESDDDRAYDIRRRKMEIRRQRERKLDNVMWRAKILKIERSRRAREERDEAIFDALLWGWSVGEVADAAMLKSIRHVVNG